MKTYILVTITVFIALFIIGSSSMIYITLLCFNIIYLLFMIYYILYREKIYFLLIYIFTYGIFLDLVFFSRLGGFSILFLLPLFLWYLSVYFKGNYNFNVITLFFISVIFNYLLLYLLYKMIPFFHLLSLPYLSITAFLLIISLVDGIIIYIVNKVHLNNMNLKMAIY